MSHPYKLWCTDVHHNLYQYQHCISVRYYMHVLILVKCSNNTKHNVVFTPFKHSHKKKHQQQNIMSADWRYYKINDAYDINSSPIFTHCCAGRLLCKYTKYIKSKQEHRWPSVSSVLSQNVLSHLSTSYTDCFLFFLFFVFQITTISSHIIPTTLKTEKKKKKERDDYTNHFNKIAQQNHNNRTHSSIQYISVGYSSSLKLPKCAKKKKKLYY